MNQDKPTAVPSPAPPTLQELKESYPNIPLVLEWMTEKDREASWEEARRIGLTPKRMHHLMKMAATTGILARVTSITELPAASAQLMADLLNQIDHPEFLTYIAAKLGAV